MIQGQAHLCEKTGLFQRSLQMYTQLEDIKRVMLHSHSIDEEFLNDYYGSMTPEDGLACIQATLEAINSPQNLSAMVKIATKYNERTKGYTITSLLS
jgi:clathrin heavy chain